MRVFLLLACAVALLGRTAQGLFAQVPTAGEMCLMEMVAEGVKLSGSFQVRMKCYAPR